MHHKLEIWVCLFMYCWLHRLETPHNVVKFLLVVFNVIRLLGVAAFFFIMFIMPFEAHNYGRGAVNRERGYHFARMEGEFLWRISVHKLKC